MMRLGISEAEAKIYGALLEKRELSALEIHEHTNVPRSKVYEITQKLILRGMCIEKLMGRKKKFQAVEPKRALNNIIHEYEHDIETKKELARSIEKCILPLYNKGRKTSEVHECVEIINDLPSIHERYVCLVRNTKRSLLGFVKGPYAHQHRNHKLDEQETAEFDILKRGAVVQTLYEVGIQDDIDEKIAHIEKCVYAGERARIIDHVPVKMYVFDETYVLMALDNTRAPSDLLTMLVIDHPALASAAKLLFDHLWEQAEDFAAFKDRKRQL
jgi:sugar-specific transcriptional regulator TrmB